MQAKEVMTRKVIAIPPELPLREAWKLMQSRNVRHLPVVVAGKVAGILSDRDVLRVAGNPAGEVNPGDEPAGTVMTPDPMCVHAGATVGRIARLMVEKKIDAVVVIDAGAKMTGLVTSTDLLLLLAEHDELEDLPFAFEIEPIERPLSREPRD